MYIYIYMYTYVYIYGYYIYTCLLSLLSPGDAGGLVELAGELVAELPEGRAQPVGRLVLDLRQLLLLLCWFCVLSLLL